MGNAGVKSRTPKHTNVTTQPKGNMREKPEKDLQRHSVCRFPGGEPG